MTAPKHHPMAPEVDGNESDAVAICGFSIKFPQEATSADAFWEMLVRRKCAMTEFPADRINHSGFRSGSGKRTNTFSVKGGHFIKEDLSVFDADFFNISPAEAAAMDPMQRWLLEAAYRALENAGLSMEAVSGTSTGVYTGCFTNDYMTQLYRDPECTPSHMATGVGSSMLANRISWFFNLHGPSMAIDTACSSAATALDLAYRGLKTGSCDLGMVAGCNLTFGPEFYQSMSNMNFLSPDSLCYSFDQRANGYSRGEGIAVIILKRLSDAIQDGNTVRAVIRATGCNEDGRTAGITQPSGQAQERLLRETYRKAALSMAHTRYFEAHGTGTPIGDPIEAVAAGKAFGDFRSASDPIYMGAVKSNIGHLEGASALAGIIKAVLVLEKGVIPPNANFEKLNPKINDKSLGLKFPERCYDWPTSGLRRASVSSFGYGGSNSHIVLDDAYNFMRLRGMQGRHCTTVSVGSHPVPRSVSCTTASLRALASPGSSARSWEYASKSCSPSFPSSFSESSYSEVEKSTHPQPRLLLWSAGDENGINRLSQVYEDYISTKAEQGIKIASFLDDMAYTLNNCRTHLAWRSYAVLQPGSTPGSLRSQMSHPVQARAPENRLGFVFTGQGAQWFAMGRELLSYSSFNMDLKAAGSYLKGLGCTWSVCDEMLRTKECSNIDDPEISQTLCTILQIALVNLLRSFGIRPHAVVGHSSGEIASAYAAGFLSAESAYKLAYFRGLCSAEVVAQSRTVSNPTVPGAMLSVALSKYDTQVLISSLNQGSRAFGLTVACENSPRSVTVAGEDSLIDRLKVLLDEKQVFARKLRVPVAYHSRQMEECAAKYASLIGDLSGPPQSTGKEHVYVVSSVTGRCAEASQLLSPSYWSQNMVAPVQFSLALSAICSKSPVSNEPNVCHGTAPAVDLLIEIGPHSALQGPIREILADQVEDRGIVYNSVLKRGQSAHITTLQLLGQLFCRGMGFNLAKVNELALAPPAPARPSPNLLVDLPEYPFNHSRGYWHESRISRNFRLRRQPPSEFLGVRSSDWSHAVPRWRHFIRTSELPWSLDHVIDGSALYPAAGMLVMAIEAIREMTEGVDHVEGYSLHDVDLLSAMDLTVNKGCLEVETTLRARNDPSERNTLHRYDFSITSFNSLKNDWTLNCRGIVTADVSAGFDQWSKQVIQTQRQGLSEHFSPILSGHTGTDVDSELIYASLKDIGLDFGHDFQVAQHQRYDESRRQSSAKIALSRSSERGSVIHPVSLDAMFHLALTAVTSGGRQRIAAAVPTRIENLWLSSKANLSYPGRDTLQACTEVEEMSTRGFTSRGIAMDSLDHTVVVWYDGLSMTNVTRNPTSQRSPDVQRQIYMRMQTKPALETLEPTEICALLEREHPIQPEDPDLWAELGLLVELSLIDLLSYVDTSPSHPQCENQKSWKQHYLHWARHHTAKCKQRRLLPGLELDVTDSRFRWKNIAARLRNTSRTADIIITVASHLRSLFDEDASPLEVLLQSGVLKDYYEELNTHATTSQIAGYIDLLAHQRPGLKILEVGGGTGGGTRNFIHALGSSRHKMDETDDTKPTRLVRCSRYDFTDVSPRLIDSARAEFGQYPQMTFGMLDIERDYAEQGFPYNEYDVVLAVQVLHITSDLKATLRRVRMSLKSGGKLILQEALDPSGGILTYIFGCFPGWWLGVDDGRTLSPSIDIESWDCLLKECGFSGIEIVREFGRNTDYNVGWIVSTAVDMEPPRSPSTTERKTRLVVRDTSSEATSVLRQELATLAQDLGVFTELVTVTKAATAQHDWDEDDFVVLLVDYDEITSSLLESSIWKQLQVILKRKSSILWVSSGGGHKAEPSHGILDGLFRTLRHEQPVRHLVSVALDKADSVSTRISHLSKVAQIMLFRDREAQYEQEYIALDGVLHTRRLVEADDLDTEMEKTMAPYQTVSVPCDGSVRFGLALDSPDTGLTRPPYYVEVEHPEARLQGDEVEVLVRCLALQPRESTIAGHFCSGIVQNAGPNASFQRGERVFATTQTPTAALSHVVASSQAVVKLPESLSFEGACCRIPPLVVGFHAVFASGPLQPEASVLLQNGATTLGQAVFRALADHGVSPGNIWTTAANEDEMEFISTTFKIPPYHVMPTTWLDNSASLVPQWRAKFDVVIMTEVPRTANFMSASKAHGRVVVVTGRRSHLARRCAGLANAALLSTVRFSVMDTEGLVPSLAALRYATEKCRGSIPGEPEDWKVFPASSIGEAHESTKTAADHEIMGIVFDDALTIDIRRLKKINRTLLNSEATYVIAGGLGGLGRAVSQWMVRNGARYLILLSRSGPKTAKAVELLSQLRMAGACIETPCCDISDEAAVRKIITSCSARFPPIVGCIQASMVLKECFFEDLKFEDWDSALAPKVKGSWNLHACLPSGLDFFILLSSIMGIVGTKKLAGYNAGNTYQAALARYLQSLGEHAICVDLGGVIDQGYVAENSQLKDVIFQRNKHILPVSMDEVYALLESCCFSTGTKPGSVANQDPEVIIGLNPPAYWKHKVDLVPFTMRQPFWGHLGQLPLLGQPDGLHTAQHVHAEGMVKRKRALDLVRTLSSAKAGDDNDIDEIAIIVSGALQEQVAEILGITETRINPETSLSTCGIDSLSAIDLRDWVRRVFGVEMTVFEILEGATLNSLGLSVAQKLDRT